MVFAEAGSLGGPEVFINSNMKSSCVFGALKPNGGKGVVTIVRRSW